ncbi:ovostatin homolog, partial [Sinocyclocheilus anshuiensis]|uniref:ovostatin homolog n=1 Tax=Sinocyclocheilus anshuiensis TaxID=1608454 RepID=UPI0007BA67C1
KSPTLSELIIENIEQPLKCDAEFTVAIKYYFVGETVEELKTDIVYIVLSRGVIVHHGSEKVEVKSSNGAASDTVSFKLSVGADLAPAVQILVYCVLPSENVVARSRDFMTEKCYKIKVFLQFSPVKAVPGEKNTLQLSAQPGFTVFNLLSVQVVSGYPYNAVDAPECLKLDLVGLCHQTVFITA